MLWLNLNLMICQATATLAGMFAGHSTFRRSEGLFQETGQSKIRVRPQTGRDSPILQAASTQPTIASLAAEAQTKTGSNPVRSPAEGPITEFCWLEIMVM